VCRRRGARRPTPLGACPVPTAAVVSLPSTLTHPPSQRCPPPSFSPCARSSHARHLPAHVMERRIPTVGGPPAPLRLPRLPLRSVASASAVALATPAHLERVLGRLAEANAAAVRAAAAPPFHDEAGDGWCVGGSLYSLATTHSVVVVLGSDGGGTSMGDDGDDSDGLATMWSLAKAALRIPARPDRGGGQAAATPDGGTDAVVRGAVRRLAAATAAAGAIAARHARDDRDKGAPATCAVAAQAAAASAAAALLVMTAVG